MNMTNDQKNALLANLNFAVEHLVEVSPPSLARLTTTLEDFESIDPALAILNGSGGYDFSIVTDGTYFVLVNAEGYNYPRYRGPRIALELLANIQKPGTDQLCVPNTRMIDWAGKRRSPPRPMAQRIKRLSTPIISWIG